MSERDFEELKNEEQEGVRETQCTDIAEVVIFRVCCDLKYRDGEHFITLYSLLYNFSAHLWEYFTTN